MKRRFLNTSKKALAVALAVVMAIPAVIINPLEVKAGAIADGMPTPVASLEFDGTADTTYVEDALEFSITNAEIVADPDDSSNTVLLIDGDCDGTVTGAGYIQTDDIDADFTDGFTISMDVRPNAQSSDWNYIFGFGYAGTHPTVAWSYVDGTIGYISRRGDAYVPTFPGTGYVEGNPIGSNYTYLYNATNVNTWNNVTFVFDKSVSRIYTNGVLSCEWTVDSSTPLSNIKDGLFNLGKGIDTGAGGFNGYMDNVKLYNKPLSTAQVEYLVTGVEPAVDATELDNAITTATTMLEVDPDEYTATSYTVLQTALATALDYKSSEVQSEVDAAAEALNAAIAVGLVRKSSTDVLTGLIGCYNFDGNVVDMITGEVATSVVVSNGAVVDSDTAVIYTSENDGVDLGTIGLKLPTTIQDNTNYTVAMTFSVASDVIGAYDKTLFTIQAMNVSWNGVRDALFASMASNPEFGTQLTGGWWDYTRVTSGNPLVAEQKYNIVLSKNGEWAHMYIDGIEVASGSGMANRTFDEAFNILLGANSWGLTDANIYDCEVYDRALVKSEVEILSELSADEVFISTIGAQTGETDTTKLGFVTVVSKNLDLDAVKEMGVIIKNSATVSEGELVLANVTTDGTIRKVVTHYVTDISVLDGTQTADVNAFRTVITDITDEDKEYTAVPYVTYTVDGTEYTVYGAGVTRSIADVK